MSQASAAKFARVRVLTVSATYGAGGSVIAPGVAKALGLDFFDRLIHGDETRNVERVEFSGLDRAIQARCGHGVFLAKT